MGVGGVGYDLAAAALNYTVVTSALMLLIIAAAGKALFFSHWWIVQGSRQIWPTAGAVPTGRD